MTEREKRSLVQRLQAGKARVRRERPQRLKAIERKIDSLGEQYRAAKNLGDYRMMAEIRGELEDVGAVRYRLKWES